VIVSGGGSGGDSGTDAAGTVLARCAGDDADVAVADVALPSVLAAEAVAAGPLTDKAGLAAIATAATPPRSFAMAFPMNAWMGGRAYRAATEQRAAVAGSKLARV